MARRNQPERHRRETRSPHTRGDGPIGNAVPGSPIRVLPTRVGMARTRSTSLYFSAGEKIAKNK